MEKTDSYYQITKGKRYPRLSEVMKVLPNVGLEKWRKLVGDEEAERISKETSEYGTKIHAITMYHDMRKDDKVDEMAQEDPSLLPHLFAWWGYTERYIKKWIAIEKLVWSDRLRVAGTIDRVDVFLDGRICIHDLKSGSLWDEIGIRLAGYKIMWNERNKKKVESVMAVQLPRQFPGEIKVKDFTHDKYIRKFGQVCEEYHRMYGG